MGKLASYKSYFVLSALALIVAGGVFYFPTHNASAAKPTKWQKKLETNSVDPALWQKYLPKISRKECSKVLKLWKKMGSNPVQPDTAAQTQTGSLGPEIAVGVRYHQKSDIIKISANKPYRIKDKDGSVIAPEVAAETVTRVKYEGDGKLQVFSSVADTLVDDSVLFDAADGDNSTLIIDTNDSDYDHYRGKIELNYWHGNDIHGGSSNSVTQIWVINKLPLDHYVWGMGETTGTGPKDHVRVMTTIFRTYGDWYIENATKYKPLGFKIRSDSGSQIYGGYDWEKDHPNIKEAAEVTRGRIVKYDGEVALTPYCSWTDGKTRALKGYPYLKSVKDHKAGKKSGLKPGQGGNHMWGLSAHGALGWAKDGKSWEWILKHYYSGVDISSVY